MKVVVLRKFVPMVEWQKKNSVNKCESAHRTQAEKQAVSNLERQAKKVEEDKPFIIF